MPIFGDIKKRGGCQGWFSSCIRQRKSLKEKSRVGGTVGGCVLVPLLEVGLPWWLSGKEPSCQCRKHGFHLWVRTIPWRRKWQPTPVFLPGKSQGQKRLVSYSPWGGRESLMTQQLNNNNYTLDSKTTDELEQWVEIKEEK